MDAEGILVSWGCNKDCAVLVEPVAAVVTFMAQGERCWSRKNNMWQNNYCVRLCISKWERLFFKQQPITVSQ